MKNQTTNELGQARKYYRGRRLPKTALSVMDAVTERLATEKVGALALLFILVNAEDIGQTANHTRC